MSYTITWSLVILINIYYPYNSRAMMIRNIVAFKENSNNEEEEEGIKSNRTDKKKTPFYISR